MGDLTIQVVKISANAFIWMTLKEFVLVLMSGRPLGQYEGKMERSNVLVWTSIPIPTQNLQGAGEQIPEIKGIK